MKVQIKIVENQIDGKLVKVTMPRLITIPGLGLEDYRAIQAGKIVEVERQVADDLFKGGFVSFVPEGEAGAQENIEGREGSE